jgi:hypothetical protein
MFYDTYIEFDTSPTNEPCVSVSSTDDYMPAMREEARRMVKLLVEKFPDVPGDFAIARQSHDFGSYLEVRYCFNEDAEGWASCNFVENNFPTTWDDNEVINFVYTPVEEE